MLIAYHFFVWKSAMRSTPSFHRDPTASYLSFIECRLAFPVYQGLTRALSPKVIDYLSKKGYSRTEAMLRVESSSIDRNGRPIHQTSEEANPERYFKGFGKAYNICIR